MHPPPARPRRRSRAAIVLGAVFGAFVLALATLVTSALRPRGDVQTFAPTAGRAVRPAGARGATDTLTLDARDERAWRYASLAPPELAAAAGAPAWDVAARRYRVIARDSVADLGPVAFESVGRAPSTGWSRTARGRDTVSAAFGRWYRYGFTSHRLESLRHVYVLPTAGGGWVKLQVLSYYCPPLEAGCVTLRVARVDPPPGEAPGAPPAAAPETARHGAP